MPRDLIATVLRSICLLAWSALLAAGSAESAPEDNVCDPGEAPDLVVADIHDVHTWATYEGITAFSIGTTSCNSGTCEANWNAQTPEHPVIGQNMFRLKGGRFEQVGQSWLKHGFHALPGTFCYDDCLDGGSGHLGVHCSDPYNALLNGVQLSLGPKSEVNPVTGSFPLPDTSPQDGEGPLHRRLQVHDVDLDPAENVGARYYVEAQYVTADDALPWNNVSYRAVDVVALPGGFYVLELAEETVVGKPAIHAWADADPEVQLAVIDLPNDGRFILGARVIDLETGFWRYEYAVQNVSSDRGARSFAVDVSSVTRLANIGFHDVDYHSGEPFDGADWARTGTAAWATGDFSEEPHANALRWGTLYNFRFDADAPPTSGAATLRLFQGQGEPAAVVATTLVPRLCDEDGVCDPGETCGCLADCVDPVAQTCCGDGVCEGSETPCTCAPDCGPHEPDETFCSDGEDTDCDGLADCADPDCCGSRACAGADQDGDAHSQCDCDDSNQDVWARPGEVRGLRFSGPELIEWDDPAEFGATTVSYEILRFQVASDFGVGFTCLPDAEPADSSCSETDRPQASAIYYYQVRAINACPAGIGSLGQSSSNRVRLTPVCP